MNETVQVYVGICALIPSIVYAFAYALGGRDCCDMLMQLTAPPRVWRRIIAPMLFSVLVIVLSLLSNKFKAGYLLAIPSYVAVHWLGGYGGEKLWVKVLRRSWTGLLSGLAALPIALVAHSYPVWELFWMQLGLAILAHLLLGILNPLKAPYEESLIALLTVVIVPFMVV